MINSSMEKKHSRIDLALCLIKAILKWNYKGTIYL